MKFIRVLTTDNEETFVNLEKVNYIQHTGNKGQYIAIDMATSMLEIEYSPTTWDNIVSFITQAEKDQYRRTVKGEIPKPFDVKVVNR